MLKRKGNWSHKEDRLRKKTITIDCGGCDLCVVNDQEQFTCSWGKGKSKVMEAAKGKKVIKCNLIKKRLK